jgi:hypothetical protein
MERLSLPVWKARVPQPLWGLIEKGEGPLQLGGLFTPTNC